jgi:hypothetical protein
MTFDQIVAEVLARTRQTSAEATTRIGRAVNDRYRRVTSSLGLATSRRAEASTVMVIGNPAVTFPGEKVLAVFLTGPDRRVLHEITFDTWRQRVSSSSPVTGTPAAYAVADTDAAGVTVHLTPVPATVGAIHADTLAPLPPLQTTDVPTLPESFQDVLVHGALADEWLQLKQDDLTRAAEGTYAARLAELRYFLAKSATLAIVQGGRAGGARGDYLPGYSVPPPGWFR